MCVKREGKRGRGGEPLLMRIIHNSKRKRVGVAWNLWPDVKLHTHTHVIIRKQIFGKWIVRDYIIQLMEREREGEEKHGWGDDDELLRGNELNVCYKKIINSSFTP